MSPKIITDFTNFPASLSRVYIFRYFVKLPAKKLTNVVGAT